MERIPKWKEFIELKPVRRSGQPAKGAPDRVFPQASKAASEKSQKFKGELMSKQLPHHSMRTISARRREELIVSYTEEFLREDSSLSPSAARRMAEKRVVDDESTTNPFYDKVFLETQPSSRSIPRKGISEIAEIRAIMGLPEIAWLKEHMETSGSTRNGEWGLISSLLFKMSYFGRPDFSNTRRQFIPGSAIDWAYGHPSGPETEAGEYFALQTMINRHQPGVVAHVQMDQLDRIANLRDPETGELAYPDMFKRCSVDGTLIEANVSQNPKWAPSKRERKRIEREVAGPRRPMVQGVWHGKGSAAEPSDDPIGGNSWRKKCVGYNYVVITCMDTGLAVMSQLMPATGNERAAVLEMLESLYILRPDFPMEYLVGDGLYGNSNEFIGELLDRYGVHAVFPVHENMSKRTIDSFNGVPICRHGLMDLDKTREVWGSEKRRKHAVKPGDLPPKGKGAKPRLRWKCPEGECEGATTCMADNRHLNTYLPHAGKSEKAALRAVLLARRNNSESLFSQIKHSGPGSNWPGRSRWADDQGMRWALSLALLQIVARRVVHLTDAYERVLEETDGAGHLTTTERRLYLRRKIRTERTSKSAKRKGKPIPPSTFGIDAKVPIDREYLLPSLLEFSDRPDRPKSDQDDEPPAGSLAIAA